MSISFMYDSAPQPKVLMCSKCGYVQTGLETDTIIDCKTMPERQSHVTVHNATPINK